MRYNAGLAYSFNRSVSDISWPSGVLISEEKDKPDDKLALSLEIGRRE